MDQPDVPQLLEAYSLGLELIFNHYCGEEEGLDQDAFMQLLTDSNIVPDPTLPEPRGNMPGRCVLGAVPAASVSKIFRSGVRNRGGQKLVRIPRTPRPTALHLGRPYARSRCAHSSIVGAEGG